MYSTAEVFKYIGSIWRRIELMIGSALRNLLAHHCTGDAMWLA